MFSTTGLARQALKKTKLKLDLLTGIDMLLLDYSTLMAEKGITGGICHSNYS